VCVYKKSLIHVSVVDSIRGRAAGYQGYVDRVGGY